MPSRNYLADNNNKRTLDRKGDNKAHKNWTATVGYTHEKYHYTDGQMRSFQS